MTFIGQGANSTIVDGSNTDSVFYFDYSDNASFSDLTVQNGNGYMGGGGIYVDRGTLSLTDVNVLSNTTDYYGGGVYAYGSIALDGGRFENNSCPNSWGDGGGLMANGTLIVSGTHFINNSSGGKGGGVYAEGSANLVGSYFERNSSVVGGGLFARGALTLTATEFVDNSSYYEGGGVYADDVVNIHSSRFENNSAGEFSNGGGLYAGGQLDSIGTQFIGNSAGWDGGGLYLTAKSRLVNVLLARNTDNAIYSASNAGFEILHSTIIGPASGTGVALDVGTVQLTNTIIASYTVGVDFWDTASEDYNLFYGVSTSFNGTVNSGGHTLTGNPAFRNPSVDDYHLTSGSVAVNNGVDAGVYTDLEGTVRPQGGGYDIGAYEFNSQVPSNQAPYTPSTPIPAHTSSDIPTTQTLSWHGGDPDGDVVTYTIAFGSNNPPPEVGATNLTSYTPSLISGTTYYWIITATDGISESASPLWNFATGAAGTTDTKLVYLPIILK